MDGNAQMLIFLGKNLQGQSDRVDTKTEVTLSMAAPEPSSTALLGLGGLALMLRRRR